MTTSLFPDFFSVRRFTFSVIVKALKKRKYVVWCFSAPKSRQLHFGCCTVSIVAQASADTIICFSLLSPFGLVSPSVTWSDTLLAANEWSLKYTVHSVVYLLLKTSGSPTPVSAGVQRSNTWLDILTHKWKSASSIWKGGLKLTQGFRSPASNVI